MVDQQFPNNHESYQQILPNIAGRRHEEINQRISRYEGRSVANGGGHPGKRHISMTPPPKFNRSGGLQGVLMSVLAALPVENGKSLCMKYISNQTCRGTGEVCVFDKRGHFKPSELPSVVRNYIVKHIGGFKAEFKDL